MITLSDCIILQNSPSHIRLKIFRVHHDGGPMPFVSDKNRKTRPISDGFRKNNVNYWAFREIRSIIPHL